MKLRAKTISTKVTEDEFTRLEELATMEPHRTVFFESYLVTQHRSYLPENERGMVNGA